MLHDLAEIAVRYAELAASRWWVIAGLVIGGVFGWIAVRRNRLPGWILLVPAIGAGAWFTWTQRSLVDDAFITFRYAENLVAGRGAVYNPGEWVQGYTNFLWMLLLATVHALTGRPTTEVALVLGPLAYVALVLATAGLGRALQPGGATWVPLASAWLAVQYSTTAFATSGLDGNFAALWVVLGAWAFVARADVMGVWLAGLAWIFATLTRPDHAVFYAVGAAVVGWKYRHDRSRWTLWAAYAAPFLVWLAWAAWAHVTYGSWVPNTYYAKGTGDWYWSQGVIYAWVSLLGGQLLWPLLLTIGWLLVGLRAARDRWLASWLVPNIVLFQLYLLRIGGDYMLGRFYLSLTPLLAIGAERFVLGATRPRWAMLGVVVLAASARGLSVVGSDRREWRITDESTVYEVVSLDPIRIDHANWRHGHQLRHVFTDRGITPVIATSGIGMVGYYSDLQVLDVRGLTDETVAHSDARQRGLPRPRETRDRAVHGVARGAIRPIPATRSGPAAVPADPVRRAVRGRLDPAHVGRSSHGSDRRRISGGEVRASRNLPRSLRVRRAPDARREAARARPAHVRHLVLRPVRARPVAKFHRGAPRGAAETVTVRSACASRARARRPRAARAAVRRPGRTRTRRRARPPRGVDHGRAGAEPLPRRPRGFSQSTRLWCPPSSVQEVTARLPPAQTGQPISLLGEERAHDVRIGLRVLAEGPADRLADPEALVRRLAPAEVEKQLHVRGLAMVVLREDGGPPHPQIRIFDPPQEHLPHRLPLVVRQLADHLHRDLVDQIPPRTFPHHPLPQRRRREIHEPAPPERPRPEDRSPAQVPLRPRPQLHDVALPRPPIRRRPLLCDLPHRDLERRPRHSEDRLVRLQVPLLRDRTFGVAESAQPRGHEITERHGGPLDRSLTGECISTMPPEGQVQTSQSSIRTTDIRWVWIRRR